MKVNARVTRNVGSAMMVSIRRAAILAPGNGTKAMTSDSAKPSTRQPVVALTAMTIV